GSYGAYISGPAPAQPAVLSPVIYYGTIDTIRQSSGNIFPAGLQSFDADAKVPSVYHYSLGIQQSLPRQLLLDVAYVGNVGRHLMQSMNLNTLPYGSRFLPQSLDPTASGRPYPDTFLRQSVGYGDLSYTFNVGTSN